jgi:hypothetical protein
LAPTHGGVPTRTDHAGRDRSGVAYSFIPLVDVVEMVRVIERRGGRCRFDELAIALGQTKTSGAFRGRTAAGRMFGVVVTVGNELVLTELGARVCSSDKVGDALAEAFLNVPLHEKLFARYAAEGGKLPPVDVIDADMMRLGVPADRAPRVRSAFIRSAEVAGYFRSGHDRLIHPGARVSTLPSRPVSAPAPKEPEVAPSAEATPMAEHPIIQGLMSKLPAEGERFTPKQRQRWLDTAKAALDLMYAGEDEDEPEPWHADMNGAASRPAHVTTG